MSAALAVPRVVMPSFRAVIGPMGGLRQGAAGATGAVRNLRQAVQRASSGVGALVTAARDAGTAARVLGQNSAGTGTALATLRRSPAATRLKRVATAAGKARRAAGRIGTGAGAVLGLLLPLLPVADVVTGLMGTFGTFMTVASVAMTGVNVAMRANPLGFLVGLIVPIAAYLVELAVNSETGQRIVRQVLQQALRTVQSVWNFLSPFMKALGKAVGTYAKAYLTVFTTALKIVGSAIGGISRIGSAVRSASNALSGIASRTLGGLKSAVQPVVRWITDKIPGFFRTAKDAVAKALNGIGDLVQGGLSAVLGVIKGPINGLIAFANWIIDGLNELSFEIPLTGKKFGVTLDRIPMLAEGGIVAPPEAGEYRIDALDELERRRVPALTEPSPRPLRVREFREEPGAGPRAAAEDLLFLLTAHARAGAEQPVLT
ncbi:tape-measure protein [Streptomyces sp. NPDC058052]|uniref:tape-measure protein n=1 Tax=Streptomyces sp. NPDC058052 TaxID=3346316 RepID=UPI0036EB0492